MLGRIVKVGLEDLAVTVGSQDHSWSSSSSWIHLQLMLFRHSQLTIFVSSETIHILITLTNRQGRGRTQSTFSKSIYVWTEFKPMKLTGYWWWWGSLTDKYQRCHLQQDCTGPVSHTVKPILGQYGSRKQVNLVKDSIWRPSVCFEFIK